MDKEFSNAGLSVSMVGTQTDLNTQTGSERVVRKYKITIGGESYFLVSDEPEERVPCSSTSGGHPYASYYAART